LSYILLLLPFSLFFKAFVPDLIVTISVCYYVWLLFLHKFSTIIEFVNPKYFNWKMFYFYFAFLLVIILSSLLSDNVLFSIKSSIFYVRFALFGLFFIYALNKHPNLSRYFCYALLAAFIFLIIDTYTQFILGKDLFLRVSYSASQVTGVFDRPRIGSYLSRLYPLLIGLIFLNFKNTNKNFLLISILFIIIDVLVFITGERTSFFYMLLSSCVIILLINKFKTLRIITLCLSIILIALIVKYSPTVKNRMIDATLQQTGINTGHINIFSPEHESHIKTALNMFLDKPILGHGPNMFRIKCLDPKYATGVMPCNTHPHNFYVQLLAETGILGFSFLFSLFWYVVYLVIRQFHSIIFNKNKRYLTDYQVCLLAGMLIAVWPFTPNGNFFNGTLAIFYTLPFIFFIQSQSKKK